MAYTGLGHLKRMSHSPGIVFRYTVETFEPNGLGLVLRDSTRVDVASDGTPGGAGYLGITAHNASYGPGGRISGKTWSRSRQLTQKPHAETSAPPPRDSAGPP